MDPGRRPDNRNPTTSWRPAHEAAARDVGVILQMIEILYDIICESPRNSGSLVDVGSCRV